MKKIIKILIITILFIFYAYILTIENIPTTITILDDEKIDIKTLLGINILNTDSNYQTILASTDVNKNLVAKKAGTCKLTVNLFDTFKLKTIDVNVIENTEIVPIGDIAGIKLYTDGVLVVGMSEVTGEDNQKYKPYESTGIEEGDRIISINNEKVSTTKDLVTEVNSSKGEQIQVQYLKNGNTLECSLSPIKTSENEYKIGLWVRDSAAGVGTITFYEPKTGLFAALGHGITDIDTGELVPISSGKFVKTNVISITRGKKGEPGRIQGVLESKVDIGDIYTNSQMGIYGKLTNVSAITIDSNTKMKIATRNEIKKGKAYILCDVDGTGTKQYEIEIEKIYENNNYDNKSMMIKVIDKNLLDKTGGIIQGMSGSPIIQNNKFIGAVTHVLVNEPTKGYAVFGDIMLKQMRNVIN